ncbi:hypothetical protein NIES4071_50310 [Calothrix sp. NIES-4071]|nr:hypothetical protein NIES4071_50310 [Calothrix sp. NIES-4071]BAZ59338.1 hypothetical protein NIES4105_50250 [Calothrix sp. NIES-4105]
MKLLTKFAAGSMLSLGFLFLIASISALSSLQDKDNNSLQIRDARDSAIGCTALGVPLVVGGGCLILGARRQNRKLLSQHLQSTFYNLVELGQGRISVLKFAKEANITGTEARQFLDNKAKEFNATFDLGKEGGIYYYFNI